MEQLGQQGIKSPDGDESSPITTQETRRSTRRFLAALVALLTVVAIGMYLRGHVPTFDADESLISNLGFFVLINVNIIVVMVLGFLVVKNLVKLVLDRRRNILGSRLRTRLVLAFVGLSLIPTVFLFLVAKGILETVMQGWFSPQIESSFDGALRVARYQYDVAETNLHHQSQYLSRQLSRLYPYVLQDTVSDTKTSESWSLLRQFLEEKREEYRLFHLALVDRDGQEIVAVESPDARNKKVHIPPPQLVALQQAFQGSLNVRPEQSLDAEFLRSYAPLRIASSPALGPDLANTLPLSVPTDTREREVPPSVVLLATQWISPDLADTLSSMVDSYDEYKTLRSNRRPIASSYTSTLVVVTLLIVFMAIWVGFYLARGLSVPIGLLAEGTSQLAHGNLEFRIPEVGDDELSVLVRSFNMMTEDLKETTGELVARRRYMETVLASVGVGVISVDTEQKITTYNDAARRILETEVPAELGKKLHEVLSSSLSQALEEMMQRMVENGERIASDSLTVTIGAKSRHLQATITLLFAEATRPLGAVILLDDVTELVSAQRVAAWREVARRIAHEIKNPLTPIQLSAQRMQRRFGSAETEAGVSLRSEDRKMIVESTDVIVKQVENLRTLVNEFSRFARLPKCAPVRSDLNSLIEKTLSIYRDAHPEILFSIRMDERMPIFEFDPEQISRVLLNLLDNAVSAVQTALEQGSYTTHSSIEPRLSPEITVESVLEDALELVAIKVSDNGIGVSETDHAKLFEPYFSTKKGGTGLGLAIVSAIMADHNGYIRWRENPPRGACFVAELPLRRGFDRRQTSST